MALRHEESAGSVRGQGATGWRRRIVSAALAIGVALLSPVVQADRAFATRYQIAAANGDIVGIGNINLHCGNNPALCSQAQNSTGSIVNQDPAIAMIHVDIDGDPATFNSSSASLSLPSGATVLFAGLYWSGISVSAARNTVRVRPPGAGAYSILTADELLDNNAGAFGAAAYQGFENVTAMVQAAGNGVYTIANVQTTQRAVGSAGSTWGGWALIVAYRDPAQSLSRNLSIFDGLVSASDAAFPVDIPFSGFVTPAVGAANATIGLVGWDGDDTPDGSAGLQYGPTAGSLNSVFNAVNPV
ncbi:MAG: hypothetical protein ACREP7_03530, partial [Lysobacter sp.]